MGGAAGFLTAEQFVRAADGPFSLGSSKSKLESKEPAELDSAAEALSNASHKLAEAMYSKTRQAGEAGAGAEGPNGGNGGGAESDGAGESKKEDVVDADFKEVK